MAGKNLHPNRNRSDREILASKARREDPTRIGARRGEQTKREEVSKKMTEEGERKKRRRKPPNCSFQRTRIPPSRYPFHYSAPLNSALGVRTSIERKRFVKQCQKDLLWSRCRERSIFSPSSDSHFYNAVLSAMLCLWVICQRASSSQFA